ncbi:MAG: phosphatase PAP2 family protein [Alicyclobacillaceae bacterium]|nr:phosphatase PAP2 family protein [Alicyclobacillaceae bacterium]
MNSFDLRLFQALNQHAGQTPVLDPVMKVAAHYALEIYAVLFIAAWFILPRRDGERRHALVVAVAGAVLALLVNAVIGAVWYRPRPFVALHGVHQLIPHPSDASFPSDHTAGGFGLASASWGKAARWLSWTITLLSLLVMVARVYVGVHWPTDVIGGMAVGIVCGRVAHLLSRPLRVITNIGLRLFRMGPFSPRHSLSRH